METKAGVRIWTAALLALVVCGAPVCAEESNAAPKKVTPVFESEKTWEFDERGMLRFFNESRNPKGARFLVWKDYTFAITEQAIVCIDERPYGTRVQGLREQTMKDGKIQSDKQLMDDLKKRAKKAREEKEPRPAGGSSLPVNIDIGAGFGFRF